MQPGAGGGYALLHCRPARFSAGREPRLGATSATAWRLTAELSLLERGQDVRTIRELLGHIHVDTTMIENHVLNRPGRGVLSPLDQTVH